VDNKAVSSLHLKIENEIEAAIFRKDEDVINTAGL
jgi:hypothetical protein